MTSRLRPRMKLNLDDSLPNNDADKKSDVIVRERSPFANFSRVVDPSGKLTFSGKVVLHQAGADFSSGSSYKIKMSDMLLGPDLGQGNYGCVKKVLHVPSHTVMAMKEIRLELDQARLNQILMELEVLHRAKSPEIVDFYGAFFIESCVYYCMEYMDAGSLDRLYRNKKGIPEHILARIADSMVKGLKFLKEELSVIHRDVKPTNVLINTKGEVKLCDFGVSGQLVQSMARTHIGCQSYMPPERITSSNLESYTTSSDIWALGMSLLECALGRYPYSDSDTVFAQLSQIIQCIIPPLPEEFSMEGKNFLSICLQKDPRKRPGFNILFNHPWLVKYRGVEVDVSAWVLQAMKENSIGVSAEIEH